MGHRFGWDGTLHHSYSRHKKYYITESPKALQDLAKIRESQHIRTVEK